MGYQVAEISKAPEPVYRTRDGGNRVVFESWGGYVGNLAPSHCTPFRREDKIYLMRTWVKRPSVQTAAEGAAGFRRRG